MPIQVLAKILNKLGAFKFLSDSRSSRFYIQLGQWNRIEWVFMNTIIPITLIAQRNIISRTEKVFEVKHSEEYFTFLLVYLSRSTITKLQMFSVTNDHFMLCFEHFWTHLTSHLNPSSCKVQIPLFLQVLIGCYTPSSRSPSSVELWFVMEFPIMLGVDWTTLFSIANDLVQPPSLVLPYIILLNLTLEFRF